ncbi:MAG: thioredoxin TrxC [Solirubrobacteraceae bacterium]
MPQLVCPSCNAANRLPEGKDASAAKCGRCHEKLFTGHPVEVTAAQLDAHRRSTRGAALLLDVWAPWCGPCRRVSPVVEEIASEKADTLKVVKLNIDENQQTPAKFNVMSIPTLMLFKHGELKKTVIGAYPKRKLEEELEPALA